MNALYLTLEIEDYYSIKPQHFISSRLLGQDQLRRLDFGKYELGITDIIYILESLPNLVELSTCFQKTDVSGRSNRYKRHIQPLVDKHAPLGPKLETLGINGNSYGLETIFALIILCPNVGRVRLGHGIQFGTSKHGLRNYSFYSGLSKCNIINPILLIYN